MTLIARLVPIKRVDRFLRIAALLPRPDDWFVVVGDGELRDGCSSAGRARLATGCVWAGFWRDVPASASPATSSC